MIGKNKTTAEEVDAIESIGGINYLKEGSLLDAQGKFAMSCFKDY